MRPPSGKITSAGKAWATHAPVEREQHRVGLRTLAHAPEERREHSGDGVIRRAICDGERKQEVGRGLLQIVDVRDPGPDDQRARLRPLVA